MNPLLKLAECGQAVWLDYIRRGLITSGELQRLVDEDGLRGLTANPAIFEKAIVSSSDYAEALLEAQKQSSDAKSIYEILAIADIQAAADIMRPVDERTNKADGYVSIEVSPFIAHETDATIAEARRLWLAIGRSNVMIKVPATPEGVPAIRQLISEGINVNITLLFAIEAYEKIADAYLTGLEARAAVGDDVSAIACVASFFVSRIDTIVDKRLSESMAKGANPDDAKQLLGKVAIANAKMAYLKFREICVSQRWEALEEKGAQKQRLLWASTGTKNPTYRDTLYVEELIGPETVNTIPPATLDAFRDHGRVRASLEENIDQAGDVIDGLEKFGISLKEVTDQLLHDGVASFAKEFEKLLSAIDLSCKGPIAAQMN
jgi:transaldolase / glucose-6-phosphate isomerase